MKDTISLVQKIEDRTARTAVIGLGYVGLPLAMALVEAGFQVTGIDISHEKLDQLQNGHSYVEDVADEQVFMAIESGRFEVSADYGTLAEADTVSICVPTPLYNTKEPNLAYVINAIEKVVEHGRPHGKLIILESTTYPGTTAEVILPRLAADGLTAGEEFFLAFSPERIDPGRTDYDLHTTPKIIGGVTAACTEAAVALYGTFVNQPVPVSSPATAEMVKMLENTFRAVNIAFVNEMALICDRLDLDVWEVIQAAATKPYGFMPFYPGPGIGGHCIPVDPHYLAWKTKMVGYEARFIALSTEVNEQMPTHVVDKVTLALNDVKKSVNGSRILVLGVAYKPNVSDVRESPALPVLQQLARRGADLTYHDFFVPSLQLEGQMMTSVDLTADALETADCVLIITNHRRYDGRMIRNHAQLIVDTRNVVPTMPDLPGRVVRI